MENAKWADNRIACSHKRQLWFAWGFAVFWNLISTPVGFIVPADIIKGNYLAAIGLLFPLIGIGLLVWAVRLTRDWRRFGPIFLSLDPFPGAIGGQVGGTLDVPVPYAPARLFRVTLSCLYSYVSGSGKNRSTREQLVWQAEGMAAQVPWDEGVRLQFLFDVPDNLPASEPEKLPYHSWRIDIKCADASLTFARQFVIPVYPGDANAVGIRDKSIEHPALLSAHLDQIESVCDFAQVPDGVELFFPVFRGWQTALAGVIVGGVFAVSGAAIGYDGGPIIFPLAFCTIGGIVFLASLDSLFNSRRVRLDLQGYAARKWWLGIPVNKTEIPRAQLRRLQLKQSYSTQSGGEHVRTYKIQLELASGKSVFVADGLRGEAVAKRLLENIALYSGIPG
jgi:hypothetical protein